jgi:hypothetical protein
MSSQTVPEIGSSTQHPFLSLTAEELDLMLQFVLVSGSFKDLARVYEVSYPTIRARVDRMIDRLQRAVDGESSDPMMQLLADLVERGEITVSTAQLLRDVYRQTEKAND